MNEVPYHGALTPLAHAPHSSGPQAWRRACFCALKLVALLLVSGCASTKVSSSNTVGSERLPRPNHIFVYNFAATPADIPPDSPLAPHSSSVSLPPEQIALGRQLGADMALQLIAAIREMGLPAEQGVGSNPQVNDIVIRGYLVAMDEGSAAKRMTIGFGSGASELTTVVEGFQMTPQGLRKIGTGTATSGGNKTPGAAVGAATFAASGNPAGLIVTSGMKIYGEASGSSKVEGRAKQIVTEVAKRLEQRFKEQGWIQ